MSGSDFVFNISMGQVSNYGALAGANDAFIAVLLKSTGLEADATLADYDTLSALLASTNDECDATNYARVTLVNVAVTVDDANDRVDVDADDISFPTVGGATNNTIGKLIVCYDSDTTSGTDADIIPFSAHSYDETTSGTTLNIVLPAGGFVRAAG